MKLKRIVIVGLVGAGLFASAALATPGFLATASPPVRGTIAKPFKVVIPGLLKLKTKGPIDVADQSITLQPGGHTGWHSHPGPALVVVKSGTFTLYDGDDDNGDDDDRDGADCEPQVFTAGQAFVDQGGGHVHIGRNESDAIVELSVTYLLPVGAGPRIDVSPAPGNCPF